MLLLTNIDIDFIMRQIIKSGYGTYKLNNRLYTVLITDIIPRIINSYEEYKLNNHYYLTNDFKDLVLYRQDVLVKKLLELNKDIESPRITNLIEYKLTASDINYLTNMEKIQDKYEEDIFDRLIEAYSFKWDESMIDL